MRRSLAFAALAALTLLLAPAAGAQTTNQDLLREIQALRKEQQELRSQIEEIKKQLKARPAAAAPSGPNVAGKQFDLAANPVKGEPGARLTLIEFTDYQ